MAKKRGDHPKTLLSFSTPVVMTADGFAAWAVEALGARASDPAMLVGLNRLFRERGSGYPGEAFSYRYGPQLEADLGGPDIARPLIDGLVRTQMLRYSGGMRFGWLTKEGYELRDFVLALRS